MIGNMKYWLELWTLKVIGNKAPKGEGGDFSLCCLSYHGLGGKVVILQDLKREMCKGVLWSTYYQRTCIIVVTF